MDLFRNACWIHLQPTIMRYQLSYSGEKRDTDEIERCHIEMCKFYVAAITYRRVSNVHEDDYEVVYNNTKSLIDNPGECMGVKSNRRQAANVIPLRPRKRKNDHYWSYHWSHTFFVYFHELAKEALREHLLVAGYRVLNAEGKTTSGTASSLKNIFQEHEASIKLLTARQERPEETWQMVAVLEGDIENPNFVGIPRRG